MLLFLFSFFFSFFLGINVQYFAITPIQDGSFRAGLNMDRKIGTNLETKLLNTRHMSTP